MNRRADFRRPENFWEEKGNMVLAVARYMGLPVYELDGHKPEGLRFHQVRYLTRKGKEKIKWLTNKPLRKKKTELARYSWTVFPTGIYPTKRSLDPKEQRYGYFVGMKDGGDYALCSAMIEVRWDGTIVKQDIDIGKEQIKDIREQIPKDFRYPKAIFAKLNRCMAQFFVSDLWCGVAYAAWYKPEDSIAVYMGTQEQTWAIQMDALKALLHSPYSDAAAVLLSYTCFSVLRPWFQDYPMLSTKSTYLEVKKKLPRVLAINAQSKELKSAEQLAELCCGAFSHMGDRKFTICDGVAVQKFPQRHSALNENEFERKVLQPANILWVNRKLAKGLRKENRVLDLQIRPGFNAATFELNTLDVVAALTAAISEKDLDVQIKILKADRNRQIPVAVKTLEGLRRVEEKYHFEFQSIGIDEELEKLRKDTPTESIVEQFVGLKYSAHTEIITEAEGEIKVFDEEVKKLFADCLREMRKIHKENSARENFLVPYYRNAIQELSGIRGVAPVVIKKITFLWASVKFFITLLPEKDREWVRRNMFRALVSFAEGQKEPWSASSYLKEYIEDEIKAEHCARIRGTKSNDESTTLWYDPKNQVFLLPASLYFEYLLPYIEEGQITRRVFEKKLVEEGALLTVKRGTQLRRTFEVKTQVGEASISVLRIPLAKFWRAFREDPQILNRIRRWHRESTPLRGDNRGFHR